MTVHDQRNAHFQLIVFAKRLLPKPKGGALVRPHLKISMQSTRGTELFRRCVPLVACPNDLENSIEDETPIDARGRPLALQVDTLEEAVRSDPKALHHLFGTSRFALTQGVCVDQIRLEDEQHWVLG
jgi:hypothetical protein